MVDGYTGEPNPESRLHKSALGSPGSPEAPRTWSAVRDMFDTDLKQRQSEDLEKLEAKQRRELEALNQKFEAEHFGPQSPQPPSPSSTPHAASTAAHYYPAVMSPHQESSAPQATGTAAHYHAAALSPQESSAVAAVDTVTRDVREALSHEKQRADREAQRANQLQLQLDSEAQRYKSQLRALEDQLAVSQDSQRSSMRRAEDLQRQMHNSRLEFTQAAQHIDGGAEASELRTRCAAAEMERGKVHASLVQLTEAHMKAQSDCSQACTRAELADAEKRAAEEALSRAMEDKQAAQKQRDEAQASLLQERNQRLQGENQVLKDRSELLAQLEVIRGKLSDEEQRRAAAEARGEQLEQAMGELERHAGGLTQENGHLQGLLQQEESARKAVIMQMQRDEELDQSKMSQLEKQLQELKHERDVAIASAARWHHQVQALEAADHRATDQGEQRAVGLVEAALEHVRSLSPPTSPAARSDSLELRHLSLQNSKRKTDVGKLERFAHAKAAGDERAAKAMAAELGDRVGGVPLQMLQSMSPAQVLGLTKAARKEIQEREAVLEQARSSKGASEHQAVESALEEAVELLSTRGGARGSPGLQELAGLFD